MTAPRRQLFTLFLRLSDLLLLAGSLGLTIVLNYDPAHRFGFALDFLSSRIKVGNAILGGLLLVIWHLAFSAQGLYQPNRLRMFGEEMKEVGRAILIAVLALLAVAKIGQWPTINLWTAGCFGMISLALDGVARLGLRLGLRWFRLRGHNSKTLLVIGGGARAQQFAECLTERRDLAFRLLGYVDSDTSFSHRALAGSPWLGRVEDLPEIVAGEVVDEVVIALPIKSHYVQMEMIIALLEEQGITVHLLSDLFQPRLAQCQPTDFQGIPFVSLRSVPEFDWRFEVKRLIDVAVASGLLVFFFPLFVLVAVAIKLDSAGPVFFVQLRMGYNKRRFPLLKFRTMVVDAEARMKEVEHLNEKAGPIFKIRNDPRVTRVGRWLRKTSVDELPQLINVILGDMSLVGPRPLSIRDALGLEEAWQKRRFSVKPGITCLWQVSGRSNLTFEQWMLLDLEYIDHWSLALDCRILLRTIPAVFSGEGAA